VAAADASRDSTDRLRRPSRACLRLRENPPLPLISTPRCEIAIINSGEDSAINVSYAVFGRSEYTRRHSGSAIPSCSATKRATPTGLQSDPRSGTYPASAPCPTEPRTRAGSHHDAYRQPAVARQHPAGRTAQARAATGPQRTGQTARPERQTETRPAPPTSLRTPTLARRAQVKPTAVLDHMEVVVRPDWWSWSVPYAMRGV